MSHIDKIQGSGYSMYISFWLQKENEYEFFYHQFCIIFLHAQHSRFVIELMFLV